jgi:hypothetical protein
LVTCDPARTEYVLALPRLGDTCADAGGVAHRNKTSPALPTRPRLVRVMSIPLEEPC